MSDIHCRRFHGIFSLNLMMSRRIKTVDKEFPYDTKWWCDLSDEVPSGPMTQLKTEG